MHYTLTTPPASRAAERPTPVDDALVAEARRLLSAAVAIRPPADLLNRRGMHTLFAAPMRAFCAGSAPTGAPVEKMIVAVKLAWASMPGARLTFGESAPEALSAAVTACIEGYFLAVPVKAD